MCNVLYPFRPILTEFKATKVFEKRRSKSDVFFLFVKDESEKSDEYKVLNTNLVRCDCNSTIHKVFTSVGCYACRKLFKISQSRRLLK